MGKRLSIYAAFRDFQCHLHEKFLQNGYRNYLQIQSKKTTPLGMGGINMEVHYICIGKSSDF